MLFWIDFLIINNILTKMVIVFNKYHGAGNGFIVIDNSGTATFVFEEKIEI